MRIIPHSFTEAQGLCFCGFCSFKLFILCGLNASPQSHSLKLMCFERGGGWISYPLLSICYCALSKAIDMQSWRGNFGASLRFVLSQVPESEGHFDKRSAGFGAPAIFSG